MPSNKQVIIKLSCSFILSLGLIKLLSSNISLLISNTDSLPQHYFLRYYKLTPVINNYTVVNSNWYGGKVIKKIVGQAGDQLWYDDRGQLFINQQLIGTPHQLATDGRKLHPIKAQVIPEGLVFLVGDHARSFDSRYQEFGLIPINELQGLVVPII